MIEILITDNEKEQRLDRFLSKYLNNSTRSNIYKLIRKKVFKINGKRITQKDYFLKKDDVLQIYLSDDTLKTLRTDTFDLKEKDNNIPKDIIKKLDIVYEDDEILIINKKKGVLTHSDGSDCDDLSSMVDIYLKSLRSITFKPACIQRLDKNTSGLIMFCKTYDSLKRYNEKMRNREIKKYYWAVVEGKVLDDGEIKGTLTKNSGINKVEFYANSDSGNKFCHTKFRVLKYVGDYTLLELELITGKTHQIRASMQSISHPIVGDIKYGAKKLKSVNNQLLHAYKLILENREFTCESKEINKFILEHGDN